MPVPLRIVEIESFRYEVPFQTKTYLCSHCKNERNSLRWVEKFSNEGFKCDNCWNQSMA